MTHSIQCFVILILLPAFQFSLFFYCSSEWDCSLNGECINSICKCDPGWKNERCDELNLDYLDYSKGYNNETQASWGGNVIFADNKWHLFVAQMKNGCSLDDYSSNSEIIRAESDNPEGPYKYANIVIPAFAHNPTIRITPEGSYLIYFIYNPGVTPKNCTSASNLENEQKIYHELKNKNTTSFEETSIFIANSSSIYGPWDISPLYFTNPHESDLLNCSFTNPSPLIFEDSKVYLTFTAGYCQDGLETLGVAFADTWEGPYKILTMNPILPKPFICLSHMQYEDPFMYKNKRGFHLMIHSMCPSGFWNSAHAFSKDGINWGISSHMPYSYFSWYKDEGFIIFFRKERPQLILDEEGNPLYLVNGVQEWIKKNSYTIINRILH